MFISGFSSGTSAIIELLRYKGAESVLAPQNLCPDVLRMLIANGFRVRLATIDRHDRSANYRQYLSEDAGIDAVLFVHPYGVYDHSVAELTVNLGSDVLLIEDCCLCDPFMLFADSQMTDSSWYVFSFGYSKVIDLDGGGLVIGPEVLPSAIKFGRSLSRLGGHFQLALDQETYGDIQSFMSTPFFARLNSLYDRIHEHSQENRYRLDEILGDKAVIRSPWRYVYFAEEMSHVESLRQRVQRSEMDLFFGLNYPLWMLNDDGILIQDQTRIKCIGIPVNLFTDFRVTGDQVVRVAELAEDLLLCA